MKKIVTRTALAGASIVAIVLAGGASRIWK
jgi:hypothetical protein